MNNKGRNIINTIIAAESLIIYIVGKFIERETLSHWISHHQELTAPVLYDEAFRKSI